MSVRQLPAKAGAAARCPHVNAEQRYSKGTCHTLAAPCRQRHRSRLGTCSFARLGLAHLGRVPREPENTEIHPAPATSKSSTSHAQKRGTPPP